MTHRNETKLIAIRGRHDVFSTREFDAQRERVFKAWTTPELYTRWIGPRRLTTDIKTFDAKTGGSYRFIQKDQSGSEFAFHGVFHEVASPERIIYTFEYEGLPERGHAVLEAITFENLPGDRTRVTNRSVFLSIADRDHMLQTGMEQGMVESYERLDELLAEGQLED
jgi:uncharacterized protein YndB with AHSA1/START domain